MHLLDTRQVTQYWLHSECFGRVEAAGSFFTAAPNAEVAGALIVADPPALCVPAANPSSLAGRIVLVERGACTFMEKADHALRAGAAAIVIVNGLEANNVFMMGGDGTERVLPLPALMVSRPTGALLRTCATDHPTLVAHTEVESRATPLLLEAEAAAVAAAAAAAGDSGAAAAAANVPATASAAIRPAGPRGTPKHMQYTTLGGWTVLVLERDRTFNLHIVP